MQSKRGRKPKPAAEKPPTECLRERVNAAALRDIASRELSARWRPHENGPVLRTIINDFLAQVRDGFLRGFWWEEGQMAALGMQGRRYSGYAKGQEDAYFEELIDVGVNEKSVGRSLFSLPGWLRDIGRCGLQDCYVIDMVNAHVVIQSRRHPLLATLKEYVERREEVLASVPRADGVTDKKARDAAKLLFIRMLYGGSPAEWCREQGLSEEGLPAFVQQFELEQATARAKDVQELPELVARLRDSRMLGRQTHTVSDLLQYILNTSEERRAIDLMCEAFKKRGVEICAYEHDGLYLRAPSLSAVDIKKVAEEACAYPVTVKACANYDLQALTEELVSRATEDGHSISASDWEVVDEGWEEFESLVCEARRAKLTSHDIFATLLMAEKRVSDKVPWPIHDLFKLPRLALNYLWYDATSCVWVEGGANGVSRLKHYITQMLERRLSEYSLGDHLTGSVTIRRDFGNKHFRDGVESCLRSLLVCDEHFHLDPQSSLRYLNFQGMAWDRETESFVRTSPDMLISRCTGWSFEECTNTAGMEAVDKALAMIRDAQDERGLDLPSEVPEEAAQILDEAAAIFPELKFWFDFTREWEGVIYELTHLSRGLFGIQMAEALYVRGSGRNGKDTVCNAVAKVGGTYVTSVSCDALSQIKNADSASPTFASLRARRVVCVREVSKDVDIIPEVYKKFTDPFSELSGRNLYEHLVTFAPQYIAFFASNGPIKVAMDNAVRERTAIIDHVSIFTDMPKEANDVQWVNMNQRIQGYRPGFFWLFRRIYHHLVRGRDRRNIGPIPLASIEQKEIDCAESRGGAFKGFLQSVEPAKKPGDATPQTEVDKAAALTCGLREKEVNLYLAGKGFVKVRRKKGSGNVYFYQYRFEVDGVKREPQWVRLSDRSTGEYSEYNACGGFSSKHTLTGCG